MNCFSLRVQYPQEMVAEEFRQLVNKELPADMKCFAIMNTSWAFNSKNLTSSREYSYYLPTFMLKPITESYLGHPLEELFKKQDEEA
jgi:tRNA U38,U39,U40 pseudouridine synthase TruA